MALALLLSPPPVFAQDAERREAVGLAREGQYDPAIAALTELRRRYPEDVATAADLAVILTWAERHREALEVFDTIPPGRAPGYALAAAGRAARILGDLGRADRYLAEAMERSPGDRNARVLRILVLTDLQRFEEARTLFWPLAAAEPERLDVLLAGGYLHAQATEWPESLRFYTEALRLAPENREALRGRVLALEAVRAPFQAHELAQRMPKLLDPEESTRVAGTESMMRLKWGDLPADDPAKSRAEQDAAISALETQVAELQAHPGANPTPLRRARFDLLVAYQNRVRMADAVAVYEALRQEGVPVPAYAGRAAASAYLYLERPEDAEAVYRQTLEQEPADVDGQLGLFYALIE